MIGISFDIEPDLHTSKYKGITDGLKTIIKILDKHRIKATFFITCDVIEKYPKLLLTIKKEGHELALHGYIHKRFDSITLREKETQIQKSILCFQKHLQDIPKGFRAPQHSINKETLNLLEKYQFKYDSSCTPLNLLQFIFFPAKFKIKDFFSPINKYKIRKNLYELPISSFIIPAVSLVFRAFPFFLLKTYFFVLKILNKDIIIYFHSWDFIDLPKSRISRLFPKEKLINNFDKFLKYNKNKFSRLIDLI